MNAMLYVKLLRKYSKCPKCHKDTCIGDVDKTAKLYCNCGWKIEFDEDGNKIGS